MTQGKIERYHRSMKNEINLQKYYMPWESRDYNIDSIHIKILNVPYFFATKLSALKGRGMADIRTSKDLEDIVYVLNNRSSVIQDVESGNTDVIRYIRTTFSELLSLNVIDEAISSVLDYGEPVGTKEKIVGVIKNVAAGE